MSLRSTATGLRETIVNPNAAYRLAQTCPTGRHVGTVHARIESGRMTLDHPPVYLCGCADPRRCDA